MNTQVRELLINEIGLIADYWGSATSEHLRNMGADPAKLPPRDHLISPSEGELSKG